MVSNQWKSKSHFFKTTLGCSPKTRRSSSGWSFGTLPVEACISSPGFFKPALSFRKHLITENHDYQNWAFKAALSQAPQRVGIFKTEYDDWQSRKELKLDGDSLRKRNQAWLWAHVQRAESSFYWACDTGLRDWGNVFGIVRGYSAQEFWISLDQDMMAITVTNCRHTTRKGKVYSTGQVLKNATESWV